MQTIGLRLWPRQQAGSTAANAHIGLTVLALTAIVALYLQRLPAPGFLLAPPPTIAAGAPASASTAKEPAFSRDPNSVHAGLARFLSRRYRIAAHAAESVVDMAYQVGRETGIDPLLILAIIAIESRFNPIAESDMGAKGLMQVIPKFHPDKFDGAGAGQPLFPIVNIRAGARVLKQYIRDTSSVEGGLQKYNGALWDESNRYAQKILGERARYEQFAAPGASPTLRIAAISPAEIASR